MSKKELKLLLTDKGVSEKLHNDIQISEDREGLLSYYKSLNNSLIIVKEYVIFGFTPGSLIKGVKIVRYDWILIKESTIELFTI